MSCCLSLGASGADFCYDAIRLVRSRLPFSARRLAVTTGISTPTRYHSAKHSYELSTQFTCKALSQTVQHVR
eukprot:2063204-Rhodomonas_salina.2